MNDKFSWEAISLFIVGVIGAIAAAFKAISPLVHKQNQERRKSVDNELRYLNDKLTTENDRLRKEVHELNNRVTVQMEECAECREEKARLEERILYLEDLLDRNKIKFRRWRATDSNPYMDVTEPEK